MIVRKLEDFAIQALYDKLPKKIADKVVSYNENNILIDLVDIKIKETPSNRYYVLLKIICLNKMCSIASNTLYNCLQNNLSVKEIYYIFNIVYCDKIIHNCVKTCDNCYSISLLSYNMFERNN